MLWLHNLVTHHSITWAYVEEFMILAFLGLDMYLIYYLVKMRLCGDQVHLGLDTSTNYFAKNGLVHDSNT